MEYVTHGGIEDPHRVENGMIQESTEGYNFIAQSAETTRESVRWTY